MGWKYTETKQCRKCSRVRSIGAFLKCKGGKRGNVCFPCNRKTPQIPRLGNWKRAKMTYKGEPFTEAHFEALRIEQEGRCRICRKVPKDRLRVDHDHASGRVRGLLCHLCNIAIGQLFHDPDSLDRAAAYLRAA